MSNALAVTLLLVCGPHLPLTSDQPAAVSDEVLDAQRGGFRLPNGLEISFDVSRQVFANDLPLFELGPGADAALVLQNSVDAQQLRVVTTYDLRILGLQSVDPTGFERARGVPDAALPW